MQIEQDAGFWETRGQLVFRTGSVDRPTCVRQQLTAFVMDGNHHLPVHQTRTAIIADAKMSGRVHTDASLFQIRVSAIDRPQREEAVKE
jgi:hypothetical protein